MPEEIRVLHIDDDEDFLDIASELLERESDSISVLTATRPSDALEIFEKDGIDCVVSDYRMSEMEGLELLERVREHDSKIPFILFTGKGSEEVASEAISSGVTDYIQKERGRDKYKLLAKRIRNAVERYQAQRSLRESERRFRKLIEDSSDVITVVNEEGEITYQSPSVERVLGYRPDDLVGEDAFDYVHPDDIDDVVDKFESVAREPGATMTVEYRFRHKDGSWRWLQSNTRNLLHDPVVEGIVGNSRDVTERKERERELDQYRNLVENVGDAMYVLDDEGYIRMVNKAMLDKFGYSRDEVVGSHVLEFMRTEDVQEGSELIAELLNSDDKDWGTYEIVLETDDGDRRTYEDHLAVLTDNGGFRGSVGVIRDITQRKKREQRLDVLNRVLRHDLRNYMNLIIGNSELLLKNDLPDEIEKKIETIREKALEMSELSDEARQIQRTLDTERNPRKRRDIVDVILDCLGSVGEEYPQLEVEYGFSESRTQWVYASEILETAIDNVIENAVEHNDSDPKVWVSIDEPIDSDYVELKIEDNGPGIPEKEREVVQKGQETQLHHASGLGLWLIDWIVEESGGEIIFDETERGTVVTFRLQKAE